MPYPNPSNQAPGVKTSHTLGIDSYLDFREKLKKMFFSEAIYILHVAMSSAHQHQAPGHTLCINCSHMLAL